MTTDHTLRLSDEERATLGLKHAPACGEDGWRCATCHIEAAVERILAARVQPALDAARSFRAALRVHAPLPGLPLFCSCGHQATTLYNRESHLVEMLAAPHTSGPDVAPVDAPPAASVSGSASEDTTPSGSEAGVPVAELEALAAKYDRFATPSSIRSVATAKGNARIAADLRALTARALGQGAES